MATDDAVTTISESLKEADELPRKQITEIVEVLGPQVALELLAETRRVQSEGGIEVRDGTRRRTDGGVFFSLAKAKLPKADRNRIFRVRPPKDPEAPAPAPATQEAAAPPKPPAPAPRPVPVPDAPRPRPVPQAASAREVVAPGQSGRRRVVEVGILRQHVRPVAERIPEARPAPSAPRQVAPVREERTEAPEVRPLRRIVTVAPVVREEPPPSTPEAAAEKIRACIRGLKVAEQRRVVLELLREIGGLPEPEPPKPKPEPKKPEPPRGPQELDALTRERVLAAVTEALSLSTSDLARVLYGEETAGTRAKARSALDRFRKR